MTFDPDYKEREIQLKSSETKVVNLYNDAYDVYIGREGKGQDGYFGNDHPIGRPCNSITCGRVVHDRASSIAAFKKDFLYRIEFDPKFLLRVLELRGKTLGCFCKPLQCHGDVIKEWLDNHPNLK